MSELNIILSKYASERHRNNRYNLWMQIVDMMKAQDEDQFKRILPYIGTIYLPILLTNSLFNSLKDGEREYHFKNAFVHLLQRPNGIETLASVMLDHDNWLSVFKENEDEIVIMYDDLLILMLENLDKILYVFLKNFTDFNDEDKFSYYAGNIVDLLDTFDDDGFIVEKAWKTLIENDTYQAKLWKNALENIREDFEDGEVAERLLQHFKIGTWPTVRQKVESIPKSIF